MKLASGSSQALRVATVGQPDVVSLRDQGYCRVRALTEVFGLGFIRSNVKLEIATVVLLGPLQVLITRIDQRALFSHVDGILSASGTDSSHSKLDTSSTSTGDTVIRLLANPGNIAHLLWLAQS